ncbi:MAG: hypothetical protein MHPSP_000494 [Paramarteilia canceri]
MDYGSIQQLGFRHSFVDESTKFDCTNIVDLEENEAISRNGLLFRSSSAETESLSSDVLQLFDNNCRINENIESEHKNEAVSDTLILNRFISKDYDSNENFHSDLKETNQHCSSYSNYSYPFGLSSSKREITHDSDEQFAKTFIDDVNGKLGVSQGKKNECVDNPLMLENTWSDQNESKLENYLPKANYFAIKSKSNRRFFIVPRSEIESLSRQNNFKSHIIDSNENSDNKKNSISSKGKVNLLYKADHGERDQACNLNRYVEEISSDQDLITNDFLNFVDPAGFVSKQSPLRSISSNSSSKISPENNFVSDPNASQSKSENNRFLFNEQISSLDSKSQVLSEGDNSLKAKKKLEKETADGGFANNLQLFSFLAQFTMPNSYTSKEDRALQLKEISDVSNKAKMINSHLTAKLDTLSKMNEFEDSNHLLYLRSKSLVNYKKDLEKIYNDLRIHKTLPVSIDWNQTLNSDYQKKLFNKIKGEKAKSKRLKKSMMVSLKLSSYRQPSKLALKMQNAGPEDEKGCGSSSTIDDGDAQLKTALLSIS